MSSDSSEGLITGISFVPFPLQDSYGNSSMYFSSGFHMVAVYTVATLGMRLSANLRCPLRVITVTPLSLILK